MTTWPLASLDSVAQRLVNTAWTVMVLCMEAMPNWFQVRPNSDRSTWTSVERYLTGADD